MDKIEYVKQYAEYLLSYTIDYPLAYPKEINFQMTSRCPLRCKMCNISRLDRPGQELSVGDIKRILDEVRQWGTKHVSFVGGDALVRKNDTIELVRYATNAGFHTTLVSSGHFLDDHTCKALMDSGLDRLTISLDGATKRTHDFIRGEGAFERATDAMERLVRMRESFGRADGEKVRLDVSTVIMSYNFRELADIYRLAKRMRFDQIFYQAVVMDNTYKSGVSDYDKCDFWIRGDDLQELKRVVDELATIKKTDVKFIFNSLTYLKLVPEYFRLKEKFNPGRCLAGYMGLNIDPYGNISVCGMGPDTNVKTSSLSELWKDAKFRKTRMMIKKCNIPCMMLCYGKFETGELIRRLVNGDG